MAFRIGLPDNSALQNDGHIKPIILQCRTPQETNPKGHWGPNCFLRKSVFLFLPGVGLCLGPLSLEGRGGAGSGGVVWVCEGPKIYQDLQG
jgi:hypothetical protein